MSCHVELNRLDSNCGQQSCPGVKLLSAYVCTDNKRQERKCLFDAYCTGVQVETRKTVVDTHGGGGVRGIEVETIKTPTQKVKIFACTV